MQKKMIVIILTGIVSMLIGCASQQNQQQISVQQQSQQILLEQYQDQLTAQQNLLNQLNERQLQALEIVESNNVQLEQLIQRNPVVNIVQAHQKTEALPAPKVVEDTIKSTPVSQPKTTLGRVEWVWIDKLNKYVKARVDTGARSSSIHATNIQYFERDGKKWVRFKMQTHTPRQNNTPTVTTSVAEDPSYEVPIVRMVRIRQASASDYEKRPVIKLRVRIDQLEDDAEFTLTNRSSMIYPVLLGRSFLKDVVVVDVGNAFMHPRAVEGKE